MRPQVGGDLQPLRPRKRSSADLGPNTSANATPTSFMLGTARDVQVFLEGQDDLADAESPSAAAAAAAAAADTSAIDDSTYGVQSLSESALEEASEAIDQPQEIVTEMGNEEIARIMARRRSTIRPVQVQHRRDSTSGISTISGYTNETSSGQDHKGKGLSKEYPDATISHPMTPLSHASPAAFSDAPPSPRSSILHSDDELETGSQAILSSDGEDDNDESGDGSGVHSESTADSSSAGLQLVMPSLMMPSRRPFTERGKQLGKLKLLLAGARGVGKTSLIKSMVQICEDVVHIDSQSPSNSQTLKLTTSRRSSANPTRHITEIAGSTKPYPGWWSQIEESQVLRRRKSGGEEVLERNICIVDTPGYDKNSTKVLEAMEEILQYLQTQMARAISPSSMHDSELLGFLGGAGGSQVDAVLFLFDSQPTAVEIEFYEQLSKLAYVIPVLSKSDLVQEESLEETRANILQSLKPTNKRPSGSPFDSIQELFSICSSPSNDLENMDASLLMSSGYIEQLHPSQLPDLVSHLFHPEHALFLKHIAAKKLVAWRHSSPQSMALSPSPLRTNLFAPTLPRSAGSPPGDRRLAPLSPTSAALTYTSSRLRDHQQREERNAQLHLGTWADALRRNLAAERLRFEKLANSEREQWLQERLDECVFDGKVVDMRDAWDHGGPRPRHMRGCVDPVQRRRRRRDADDLDPLAIMRWRQQVLGALQVVGGVGIVSAVALWVARTFELDIEWLDEYGLGRLQELLGTR